MPSEAAVFGTWVGGVVVGLAVLLLAESVIHIQEVLILGGLIVLASVGMLTATIDRL